jgi:hypothetical protein
VHHFLAQNLIANNKCHLNVKLQWNQILKSKDAMSAMIKQLESITVSAPAMAAKVSFEERKLI